MIRTQITSFERRHCMKKYISLLIAAALLLSSACSNRTTAVIHLSEQEEADLHALPSSSVSQENSDTGQSPIQKETDESASSATVSDSEKENVPMILDPQAFAGILDVGERLTAFVTRDDGTVWSAGWDLGPLIRENNDYDAMIAPAFHMTPKKLEIGQWAGFAIDENDSLWGWAVGPYTSLAYMNTPRADFSAASVIMENVADVSLGTSYVMALDLNGQVWIWGDVPNQKSIPYPMVVPITDAMSIDANGDIPLIVTEDNLLLTVSLLENDTELSIEKSVLLGEISFASNGFAVGTSGTVYDYCTDITGLETVFPSKIVQTTGKLFLDNNNVLWSIKDGHSQMEAENCRFIVDTKPVVYIDVDNSLRAIDSAGNNNIICENILYAAAGYDGALIFIRADSTLWKVPDGLYDSMFENGKDWTKQTPVQILDHIRLP